MGTVPSNTLQVTVSCPSGNEYDVKFESASFASGKHRECYIGTLLNDKAPKHNKKVVLKVWKKQFVDEFNADYQCVQDLERSIVCHEHCIAFNKQMQEHSSAVLPFSFPAPLRINIKRGAYYKPHISAAFSSIPIQLKQHKYLTVQLYLKDNAQYKYQKLSSNNGWLATDCPQSHFVSAFSHFSWSHSKGKMLITGFQGVQRGSMLFASDAVIHSNKIGQNGHHDLGIIGMINFFLNHECNEYCKHLPVLNTTLLLDYVSKSSILKVDKSTSYLFELQQETLEKDEANMETVYGESIQCIFDKKASANEAVIKGASDEVHDSMDHIESVIEDMVLPKEEDHVYNNVVEEEDTDSDVSDDSVDIEDLEEVPHVIMNHMDVSWFSGEFYAEHKDLYDLDAKYTVNIEEEPAAYDEWELIN